MEFFFIAQIQYPSFFIGVPVEYGSHANGYKVRQYPGVGAVAARAVHRGHVLPEHGLAVGLAFRGGLFNIGAEGQLSVGALVAAWAGFAIKDVPWPLHMVLALAAGAAAGAPAAGASVAAAGVAAGAASDEWWKILL